MSYKNKQEKEYLRNFRKQKQKEKNMETLDYKRRCPFHVYLKENLKRECDLL